MDEMNVMFPKMSIFVFAALMDSSFSLNDHMVPMSPNGTLIRNMYLQLNMANRPPKIKPVNCADVNATMLIPIAFPISFGGNASLIMAALFAMIKAAPTPCINLKITISNAPAFPVDGVRYNRTDPMVNIK